MDSPQFEPYGSQVSWSFGLALMFMRSSTKTLLDWNERDS